MLDGNDTPLLVLSKLLERLGRVEEEEEEELTGSNVQKPAFA